jgi:hypothetical protein
MGKIGSVFLGVIALFLLIGPFSTPIIDGIKHWRTNNTTQAEVIATEAAQTTANVTLDYDLYQAATAEVITITSTLETDTPAATAYVEATKVLTVSGLDDSNSRTISINYYAETDDDVMRVLGPFLVILIFGGLAFAILYHVWKH